MSPNYLKYVLFLIALPVMLFAACTTNADDEKIYIHSTGKGAWLGVQVEDLSDKMLKNLDLENGVRVRRVNERSPAAKAGLEKDDIIIGIDGKDVKNVRDLVDIIDEFEPGAEIEIAYFRSGKQNKMSVALAERDKDSLLRWHGGRIPHFKYFKSHSKTWLGVQTENLTDQLREYFDVPEDIGILVSKVFKESPAESAGLKSGDVIIKIADRKIKNYRDLTRTINYYNPDETVQVTIIRDKAEKTLSVTLGSAKDSKHFKYYGFDNFHLDAPGLDIEIPEIEVEIPDIEVEIDEEALKELEEQLEEKAIIIEKKIREI